MARSEQNHRGEPDREPEERGRQEPETASEEEQGPGSKESTVRHEKRRGTGLEDF
ncbi:hypothetical protein ACFW3D_41670 [Streptomyces sp. NPDC058864]